MNFVIPMAGRGSRFSEAGYSSPKMLIEAKGKTLLEWSLESLPLHLCSNLIFIALEEHSLNNNIENFVYSRYPDLKSIIKFIFLKEVTRGQSETVLKAKEVFDNSKGLLIYNIDTWFYSSGLEKKLLSDEWDGIAGAFISSDPRYSFAKLDDKKNVVEVAEKKAISNFALTGMYYFKSTISFVDAAEEAISNNETVKNEFYIAPLYNKLISKGKKIAIDLVDDFSILGTPEELNVFIQKR
jgi:dTDP-glucose pyrophosphorylase